MGGVLFVSQGPILVVFIPVLVLVGLFEMIGLKTRLNIAVLSALSLVCLGAAVLISGQSANIAGLLYGVGVVLAVILAFYALATAGRGGSRRGHKKAIVALAHALLVIIYHVIARRQPYQELGEDSFQHHDPAARAKRLVHQLTHLGFEVPLRAA